MIRQSPGGGGGGEYSGIYNSDREMQKNFWGLWNLQPEEFFGYKFCGDFLRDGHKKCNFFMQEEQRLGLASWAVRLFWVWF